jgi:hypothetical protein
LSAAASNVISRPPIAVTLPEHVTARDVPVQSHPLNTYDQLKELSDEQSPDEQ